MEIFSIKITTLLFFLTLTHSSKALKCYQCEECNDEGSLVTCASEYTNCNMGFGYFGNYMGIAKGCDKSRDKVASTFCESKESETISGFLFKKTTGCLCGEDGCNRVFDLANVQFLGVLNYPELMKGNLKCLQCNPCVGAGVSITCPDNTRNCFQAVGMLNGTKTLIKGCAPLGSLPKQETLTCNKISEATVFNSTLMNATECLCSAENCNSLTASDPLPDASPLKCYVCNGTCQNHGEMEECPKDKMSCYIASDGSNTYRGCLNTGKPSTDFECTNYTNIPVDGKLHAFLKLCPCSKTSCNKEFPYDGKMNDTTEDKKPAPLPTGQISCYHCTNCEDVGESKVCPKNVYNCFYAEGNDKDGRRVKQKGCVPDEFNLSSSLKDKQSLVLKEYTFQNETYTNVEVVACGEDNCNDQLAPKLECYQCDMCTNKGELVTCAEEYKNCFVMSGRLGLFNVRAKGCYKDISFKLPQPTCTQHDERDYLGYKFKKILACACPTSRCNENNSPIGFSITGASAGVDTRASTLVMIATSVVVYLSEHYI